MTRGLGSHTHFIDAVSTYTHAHAHDGKHSHPEELSEMRRRILDDELERRFVEFLREDAPELSV